MKTTKELARELGLLRKRTLSTTIGSKNTRSARQPFGYLIVLDFESTCWKEKKFQTQEIIEFPAVLLNTSTGEIESEFHYYVQPQEHPVLSDFCRELTGITQEQVEDGIPLRFCLKKFSQWLDKLCKDKGVTFVPVQGPGPSKTATFVTWSDWDLGVCLFNECKRKQLLKPSQLNSWIDLRATYRKFYNRRPNGLNGALQDLGITFEGREHSGLHDARNTATLAWRMTRDGCVLTTTKTLNPKSETGGKFAVASKPMVCESGAGVPKSVTTPLHQSSPSRSPCQKKRKTDSCMSPWRPVNSSTTDSSPVRKVCSNNRLSCVGVTTPNGRKSRIPVRSPKCPVNQKSIVDQIYRDPEDVVKTVVKSPKQDRSYNSSGLTCRDQNILYTSLKPKQISHRNSSTTDLKTPNLQKQTSGTVQKRLLCTRTMSSAKENCYQAIGSSFKTPSSPKCRPVNSSLQSLKYSLNLTGQTPCSSTSLMSGSVTPANSFNRTSFRTPNSADTSSGMKGTPPLCKCGKRSKRRMAQTPGPNMGRFFFSCGSGSRSSNQNDSKKGCGFFLWEPSGNSSFSNSSFQNNSCQSFRVTNTSLPFKQVGHANSFSQRKSLGVRSAVLRPLIR